jgi:hypothetical protein
VGCLNVNGHLAMSGDVAADVMGVAPVDGLDAQGCGACPGGEHEGHSDAVTGGEDRIRLAELEMSARKGRCSDEGRPTPPITLRYSPHGGPDCWNMTASMNRTMRSSSTQVVGIAGPDSGNRQNRTCGATEP